MNHDFEKLAARAAPAIFVVLWSTGFVATKYVLNSAEPLTFTLLGVPGAQKLVTAVGN